MFSTFLMVEGGRGGGRREDGNWLFMKNKTVTSIPHPDT